MEFQAVIHALQLSNDGNPVRIKSDSKYMLCCIKDWAPKWKLNGWRSTTGVVKNRDLIMQVLDLIEGRQVSLGWVPGHKGIPGNELADRLAGQASRRARDEAGRPPDQGIIAIKVRALHLSLAPTPKPQLQQGWFEIRP
jgi:ribonuclease HI